MSSNIFGENTNSKGNDKKMVQDMQVEMEFLFKLKLRWNEKWKNFRSETKNFINELYRILEREELKTR